MTELDSIQWRLIAACSAVAPAAALIAYFCMSSTWRHLRELVWISFGLGFSLAIPIAGVTTLYAPMIATIPGVRLHALAVAFLEASVPEELGKLLVVFCILLRHEDLRRPIDTIVATVTLGLGFATIENLYYVFGSENWTETALLRSLTAVPMHATVGIVMGYFAARYLLAGRMATLFAGPMFFAPTVLHGFYDYPVFAIQQLLAIGAEPAASGYREFQTVFIAAVTASALAALATFRHVGQISDFTQPAPWFRMADRAG